jgi:hypothetical protein
MIPKEEALNPFCSQFQVSLMHFKICSEGHAQLKPTPSFRNSIFLSSNDIAREFSPHLDVQEFVERSCSLNYSSMSECWRQMNGVTTCSGTQNSLEFWIGIPEILVFEPEPETINTKNSNNPLLKY